MTSASSKSHLLSLATWEAEIGRIAVGGQPVQFARSPISKIPRAKWTGGVAQAVEHLLYMYKALGWSPSRTINK
jgi:hypothetical protein